MSAEQTAPELTTRDVLLQVDRRLTLIERDLRTLGEKSDAHHLATQQDIFAVKQDILMVKQDVPEVKRDVSEVKQDILMVKQDILMVKQDVSETKQDIFAVKRDVSEVKQDVLMVKRDLGEMELRLKHDLTLRLGGMMVVGITLVATLVKLL